MSVSQMYHAQAGAAREEHAQNRALRAMTRRATRPTPGTEAQADILLGQEAAVRTAGAAQERAATMTAEEMSLHAGREAGRVARYEERRTKVEARIEEQLAAREKAIAAVEEHQVDPTRFWRNRTVGQQIWAAIAMGIAEVERRPGESNRVADTLDRMAAQDVEMQLHQLGEKKGGVTARQNTVSLLREQLGDLDQAAKALYEYHLASHQARLAQIGATTKSPEQRAATEAIAGEIQSRRESLIQADKARQMARLDPLTLLKREAQGMKYGADIARAGREIRGEPEPGKEEKPPTAVGQDDLADRQLLQELHGLEKHVEKYGMPFFKSKGWQRALTTEASREYGTRREAVLTAMMMRAGGGVGLREAFEAKLPSHTEVAPTSSSAVRTDAEALKAIRLQKRQIVEMMHQRRRQYGGLTPQPLMEAPAGGRAAVPGH